MKLRPYQEEAANKLTNLLRNSNTKVKDYTTVKTVNRYQIVLPTGAGKTFTMVGWINSIKNEIKSVIWACHRDELKRQAYDTFRVFFEEDEISIWDAKQKEPLNKINIVMIPSSRNFEVKADSFSEDCSKPIVTVFDEAHHMDAPTWDTLLNKIYTDQGGMCVGITATPIDKLKKTPTIYEAKFYDLVDQGYLAKPKFVTVQTKCEYNFTIRNGEFTSSSLAQLDDADRNFLIFNHWKDNQKEYGKVLVFCASVAQSESLYQAFKDNIDIHNLDTNVYHINGTHTLDYRTSKISKFQKSKADIMINCSVFTEGFDDKTINTVFLCRPTMSGVLYKQMIGRGSRITDTKNSFQVVDFVDVIKRYELARNHFVKDLTGQYLDKDLAKEEELLEQEKEAKKNIKAAKLTAKQRKRGVDAIEVTGWLDASNRYFSDKFILIKHDVQILASVFYHVKEHLNSELFEIKKFIDRSYGEIGFSTLFNYKEWKNICWSIVLVIRSGQSEGSFKMNFFDPSDKPKKVAKYFDLICDNLLINNRLNKAWNDKETLIFDQICEKVTKEICPRQAKAIRKYMKPLSYKNRIFTLEIPSYLYTDIVYHDIGVQPGLNSLKLWKKNITKYLRLIVSDNDAAVTTKQK